MFFEIRICLSRDSSEKHRFYFTVDSWVLTFFKDRVGEVGGEIPEPKELYHEKQN